MPTERRSIHSNTGGSSDPSTQNSRLSDNQWLADEVYPTIGTSRNNSISQSRSRQTSSPGSNHSIRASLDDANTTMHARDIPAGSIAFAEDYKPANDHRPRSKSRSRLSSESSASRSRSRSTYDTHRLSTEEKVWAANDTERKHGKFLDKVLSHKLSPSFLK